MDTSRENMSDQELIDALLHDRGFQGMVESDIGKVKGKVVVDWKENTITIHGTRQSKQLKIDETLAVLRKQIQ